MSLRSVLTLCVVMAGLSCGTARGQDLNEELEKLTKDAAKKVAPGVVQIVTQGGADMVVTSSKGQVFRKALGPTTGVIVGADGWVISSAFNFLNNPTSILVAIPGRKEPLVAQRVATDRSRMLTLLKIDATGLPVPTYVPKKEIQEGQWAIALGRTLDTKLTAAPSVSVGIISATGRIWGKALQTDAKVSPLNYGGPLVDLQGRVQGVLIPASPRANDETAGFEWYDSGIGFAIPMEDVLAVLPRLKQGKDLHKGLLGVQMKSKDIYGALPVIGGLAKGSAAEKAGLKPGDILTELDGKPVVRMAQVQHILGTKYEGDKVSLKYKRGAEVKSLTDLVLTGQAQQVVAHGYLGILPMRDDPKLGVEVRFVFDKSPASKAGIKAGDRVVKYGAAAGPMKAFSGKKRGRDELMDWLNVQAPGNEVRIEVARAGGKAETLKLVLDPLPGSVNGQDEQLPAKLPEKASVGKALEPLEMPNAKPAKIVEAKKPKIETGLVKKNTPDGEHKYWVYIPENYDPNVAHALVVWLHPPGKNKDEHAEELTDLWADFCEKHHIVMMGPISRHDAGWIRSETDFVVTAVRDVLGQYTIDRRRVVAHGLGAGGQMALHLGLNQRDLFPGVAAVGAVVTQAKPNTPNQRVSFFLAGGALDPLIKSIAEGRTKLVEKHYPVLYREIPNRGREYLDEAQLRDLIRWIDMLDRE